MKKIRKIIFEVYYLLGRLYVFFRRENKDFHGILMFHRVLPRDLAKNDHSGNTIAIEIFEEFIKYIAENKKPVTLDEYLNLYENSRLTNEIVVTFDDGYRDNLIYALPILEKYNIPAIIYITTGLVDGTVEPWWYKLPTNVLGSELSKNLMYSNNKQRKLLLKRYSLKLESPNLQDMFLNHDEIKLLSSSPLITIGAHTVSHPTLRRLSEEELNFEISKSKESLEKLTNKEIKHFAYPYGRSSHAEKREYEWVKRLGFTSAVTTNNYISVSDLWKYCLPRINIGPEHNKICHLQVKLSKWNSIWKTQL